MLHEAGHNSAYILWSALEAYFDPPSNSSIPCQIIGTEATLPDLAKLPGDLSFPGFEWADVVWSLPDNSEVMVRCLDNLELEPSSSILQARLLKMPGRGIYRDPHNCYRELRKSDIALDSAAFPSWYDAAEAAILISRYPLSIHTKEVPEFRGDPLSRDEQRVLLLLILGGRHAEKGLAFLGNCGFIKNHWPLLQRMGEVEQSKEFHPEGNVWEHTLNAISHQKRRDPYLGMAILLHDCGKAFAEEHSGNRFHRHAQIGAYRSRKFLEGLAFPREKIDELTFIVEQHMLPSFLRTTSPSFLQEAMDNPLFPALLELYRCDIASSFRPLDPYYQACKLYKRYKQ